MTYSLARGLGGVLRQDGSIPQQKLVIYANFVLPIADRFSKGGILTNFGPVAFLLLIPFDLRIQKQLTSPGVLTEARRLWG